MKDRIQKLIEELSPKRKTAFNQITIKIRNGGRVQDRIKDDKLRVIVNPKVRERDKGECCFCKKDVFKIAKEIGGANTIHHIHPKRYGGRHKEENLITICAYCHQRLEKYLNVVDDEAIRKTLKYVKDKLKELNSH